MIIYELDFAYTANCGSAPIGTLYPQVAKITHNERGSALGARGSGRRSSIPRICLLSFLLYAHGRRREAAPPCPASLTR